MQQIIRNEATALRRVMVFPLRNPLVTAKMISTLDNLSGGRMELGLGMGYAAHEFKGFGIPQSRRVSLTEETIEILRLAWTGEPFSVGRMTFRWANARQILDDLANYEES